MPAKQATFVVDKEQPEIAQACSLALAVLGECSTPTWRDLCDGLDGLSGKAYDSFAQLVFSGRQEELLDEYQPEFQYLSTTPLQTVAVCPKCEQWLVLNSDVPKRCLITLGCSGLPVKISAAKKNSNHALVGATTK